MSPGKEEHYGKTYKTERSGEMMSKRRGTEYNERKTLN